MLEPATPNPIPDRIQPPPLPITVNDELEFEISEILDSKIDNRHHTCKLLYLVLKKPPGYSLPNSDKLPNSSWTSTLHTQPSLALCQVFPDSDFATFWCSSFFEDHTCYFYFQVILIILSTVESFLHHLMLLAPLPEHPLAPLLDSFPAPFLFPSPSSSYAFSPPTLILLVLPVSPSPGPSGNAHPA